MCYHRGQSVCLRFQHGSFRLSPVPIIVSQGEPIYTTFTGGSPQAYRTTHLESLLCRIAFFMPNVPNISQNEHHWYFSWGFSQYSKDTQRGRATRFGNVWVSFGKWSGKLYSTSAFIHFYNV